PRRVRDPVQPQPGDRLEALGKVAIQVDLVRPDLDHAGYDALAARGAGAGATVVGADPGEVLDRGRDPGQALEVARSRLEPVRRGPKLVGGQAIEDLGPAVQDPGMRAEELVGRAREEVRVDRTDVDRQVRRRVDRVDIGPGAGGVVAADDLRDGVDRADRVRRPA